MYEALKSVPCNNGEAGVIGGLEARYYTDPSIYELEKERIFYRAWICLGHQCMAPELGSYFTGRVADQEILVVRNEAGELGAFYNACQHRGHPLADGHGECKRLVCPYHAWTYDLDGRLMRAPHGENIPSFDPTAIRLRPVRLDTLAGAVFVNLDDEAPGLHEVFEGLEDELLAAKPDMAGQQWAYDHPYPHHCNWKASVENFSECYHCGPVHKYLTDNVIDPSSYVLTGSGLVQRHKVSPRQGVLTNEATQTLWHIWPNTAIGLYPIPDFGIVLCIRHMYPVTFEESIYHYRWFADADRPIEPVVDYAKHHAETTGAEDGAVASGVQRGMRSKGFERARLFADPKHGVSSEHVIAYFQQLVRTALDCPVQ